MHQYTLMWLQQKVVFQSVPICVHTDDNIVTYKLKSDEKTKQKKKKTNLVSLEIFFSNCYLPKVA